MSLVTYCFEELKEGVLCTSCKKFVKGLAAGTIKRASQKQKKNEAKKHFEHLHCFKAPDYLKTIPLQNIRGVPGLTIAQQDKIKALLAVNKGEKEEERGEEEEEDEAFDAEDLPESLKEVQSESEMEEDTSEDEDLNVLVKEWIDRAKGRTQLSSKDKKGSGEASGNRKGPNPKLQGKLPRDGIPINARQRSLLKRNQKLKSGYKDLLPSAAARKRISKKSTA